MIRVDERSGSVDQNRAVHVNDSPPPSTSLSVTFQRSSDPFDINGFDIVDGRRPDVDRGPHETEHEP